MKQRFITYAICASILFHMTGNICYAKEESYITTSYPSIIEEYDELYFLENMYMENIYYENYYSKEMKFQRIDLTNHPFGQELRHEIEYLYALQQTNHIDATLKHSVDFSYEEYAARLLTAKELMTGCNLTEVGRFTTGELDSCNYIMENTKYAKSSIGSYGPWLETPRASCSNDV